MVVSKKLMVASLGLMGALFNPAVAQAQTEVQWWHSMTGALGERLGALAEQFNKSQSEYKIVATYKGSYPEAIAAAVAAYRSGNAPHILQVFEVGTATMMNSKGAIVPVEKIMKDAGEKFDRSSYVPAVSGYYTNRKGEMLSFPFNSSTVVFYYNKDAFQKAGVAAVPETWNDVTLAAAKIKASGASTCAYTTGWQSWVHVENFSAWHNTLVATNNNGFDSVSSRMLVNTPLHVKHISNMQDWVKRGYFTYAGRRNEPEAKFFSGECAMLTSSSAAYGNIARNAKFKWGIGKLPYYSDVAGAPQNTLIGGASLWVIDRKSVV